MAGQFELFKLILTKSLYNNKHSLLANKKLSHFSKHTFYIKRLKNILDSNPLLIAAAKMGLN